MGCEKLRSRAKAWDLTSLLREFHWTPSNYSIYSLASDLVRLIEIKITEAQIRTAENVRLIGYRQYLNSDSKHICSIMLWTFIHFLKECYHIPLNGISYSGRKFNSIFQLWNEKMENRFQRKKVAIFIFRIISVSAYGRFEGERFGVWKINLHIAERYLFTVEMWRTCRPQGDDVYCIMDSSCIPLSAWAAEIIAESCRQEKSAIDTRQNKVISAAIKGIEIRAWGTEM